MQICKTGHLAPDLLQALLQSTILHVSCRIEYLPRFWNGRLFRDHPRVQRATYGTQIVQCAKGAQHTARDPHQTQHLPLEFLEAHEVERVLEDATIATVEFG